MHQHLTLRGGTIPMTDQRVLERVHGFCGCIQCMEGERDRPRGSASFQKVKSKKKHLVFRCLFAYEPALLRFSNSADGI